MIMVYNDTSTKQGLLQECESIVFASNYGTITDSTTLTQTFTRYTNQAIDHIVNVILGVDDRWQYDDSTYTDFPIATTTLVANQQDYSLSTSHLKVLGVSVLDNSGIWMKLKPIDPVDMGQDRSEFQKVAAMPIYYDLLGNSLFLYPKPAAENVTLTNGLRVYFQRVPNYFTTSDTTKQPGFPSIFHRLVALWASYFYCQANNVSKIAQISDEIKKIEEEIKKYYQKRNVEDRLRITTAPVWSN